MTPRGGGDEDADEGTPRIDILVQAEEALPEFQAMLEEKGKAVLELSDLQILRI